MEPRLNAVEREIDAIEALCAAGAFPGALERLHALEDTLSRHLELAAALLASLRLLRKSLEAGDRASVGPVASDLRNQLASYFETEARAQASFE